MLRAGEHKLDHIGDILRHEGVVAFIDLVGTCAVALEAHKREVGLGGTRRDLRDLYVIGQKVGAHSLGEGEHSVFRGAIDVAAIIDLMGGCRADIDDMPALALHHAWRDKARHIQQSLDVGVDHALPILQKAILHGVELDGQSGIVDEDIHVAEFHRHTVDSLLTSLGVAHIKDQREHLRLRGSLYFLSHLVELVGRAACDYHVDILFGKRAGNGLAEAARRTSDEYNFHNFIFLNQAAKIDKKMILCS